MIARLLPAIALAAACSGGSTMRVRLDVEACDEDALEITLPCEGVIGVWLVDAQDRVLEESCILLEQGTPLFVLDDILRDQVAFGGRTPGEIVAIELGVFGGEFADPPVCPRDAGLSFVFGRSEDFEVGAVTDIDLILTCFDTSNECDPAFVVNATLTEFGNGEAPPATRLLAGVVDQATGAAKFTELAELVPETDALWSGQLGAAPEGACFAAVVVDGAPLLPLLSCDSTVDESAGEGFIEAYTVDVGLRSTTEQEISTGAGVLGRVVDAGGMPVGGASVDAGGALVEYFNEAMTGAGTSRTDTASHGLFIVHGPGSECCQTITAVGPLPGAARGSRRTGHVVDHLVTTVIRLDTVDF